MEIVECSISLVDVAMGVWLAFTIPCIVGLIILGIFSAIVNSGYDNR